MKTPNFLVPSNLQKSDFYHNSDKNYFISLDKKTNEFILEKWQHLHFYVIYGHWQVINGFLLYAVYSRWLKVAGTKQITELSVLWANQIMTS